MIQKFLAAQLRRPSGFCGKFVMGSLLNKANVIINTLVVDTLILLPEDRVLDVGFGGGSALQMVANKVPRGSVTGADFSPEMVQGARRHFDALVRQGRADFHVADVIQLSFTEQTFDKVLTVNTLYFWPDPVAGLREIRRVMKPGAKLVVAIRSEEKMALMPFSKHGFRLFSPEALRQKLTEAGFLHVDILHADREKPFDSLLGIAIA